MQFTTRQLLLWITGLAAWFGAMAEGNYLFGPYGVLAFGSLFGISILLLVKMVWRWSKWSLAERAMSTCALLASLCGGIFLANLAFGYGYHIDRARFRDAQRLQKVIQMDSRYQAVLVTYEGPKPKIGHWLWVRGSVATQENLETLHRMIDEERKWRNVQWEVYVDR